MKKFNWKTIDWRDKKLILPLLIFFPGIIMVYFIYETIDSFSQQEEIALLSSQQNEVANIPLGDSIDISNKADAILEGFKQDKDFTAIQELGEYTRLQTDTTLYTQEELEAIIQQNLETKEAKQREREINEQIEAHNTALAESKRGRVQHEDNTNSESSLDKEIRMYQKILKGEEILTEEEEAARKEALIRQDERNKIHEEQQKKETIIVEKVSSTPQSVAFNTIRQTEGENSSYIRAMVDQGVTVTPGSRIRFRLLDDIRIQGTTIPSGTHIYATVSAFGDQRVKAEVKSIVTKGKRFKVNLFVYDYDGIEGFFIPKSSFRDLSKEASAQALGQSNINFNNSAESVEGVALQAIQGVYQSASRAISSKIKERKAKIKYNTTIYLINNNE